MVRSEAQCDLILDSRGLDLLLSDSPENRSRSRGVPSCFSDPCGVSTTSAPCLAKFPGFAGSALRFSQPPSGFSAHPNSAALSHAAPIPGYLSLQSLPLTEIAHPSRGRLLPCSHPRCSSTARARAITRGFPDSRTEVRWPGFPLSYGLPFRGSRRFPVAPGSCAAIRRALPLHLLRSFLSPCESVRCQLGFPV